MYKTPRAVISWVFRSTGPVWSSTVGLFCASWSRNGLTRKATKAKGACFGPGLLKVRTEPNEGAPGPQCSQVRTYECVVTCRVM
jgi:hypothetical protein